MVAVRHPRLVADHLLSPTAEAFAGVGVVSFAGLKVVDIVPRTTTKVLAVADEMASMGCAAETTVVFGDMPNDLPLFGWAGLGLRRGQRPPHRACGRCEIVPSNDDDGVARTVQRLVGAEGRGTGPEQASPNTLR